MKRCTNISDTGLELEDVAPNTGLELAHVFSIRSEIWKQWEINHTQTHPYQNTKPRTHNMYKTNVKREETRKKQTEQTRQTPTNSNKLNLLKQTNSIFVMVVLVNMSNPI